MTPPCPYLGGGHLALLLPSLDFGLGLLGEGLHLPFVAFPGYGSAEGAPMGARYARGHPHAPIRAAPPSTQRGRRGPALDPRGRKGEARDTHTEGEGPWGDAEGGGRRRCLSFRPLPAPYLILGPRCEGSASTFFLVVPSGSSTRSTCASVRKPDQGMVGAGCPRGAGAASCPPASGPPELWEPSDPLERGFFLP